MRFAHFQRRSLRCRGALPQSNSHRGNHPQAAQWRARQALVRSERASGLTFARGKLVPPDDGRFSLSSIGLGDWSLEGIEPVARLSDLLPPGGEPRDVLLYVHGFNTTFETAALDAARLSDGIRFRGQTMLFSWPSKAKLFETNAKGASLMSRT